MKGEQDIHIIQQWTEVGTYRQEAANTLGSLCQQQQQQQQMRSHLRKESTFISPPIPTKPNTKENHVAVMRYVIDFLMKHNITVSCPWFFCYHTHSHKHVHTHRKKNQYNPVCLAKSNTQQFISIGFQSEGRCLFCP